jgi:hypothetical protein
MTSTHFRGGPPALPPLRRVVACEKKCCWGENVSSNDDANAEGDVGSLILLLLLLWLLLYA